MQAKTKRILVGVGFWLLSLTWGCLMTFIGLIGALVCIVTGKKPKRFHYLIYFELEGDWGGFSIGPVFFVCKNSSLSLKCHEAGHGLQNIIFGVFMPFVVSIPSCIRYWYREYKIHKGLGYTLPDYDSIWFEGWATYLGIKYFG